MPQPLILPADVYKVSMFLLNLMMHNSPAHLRKKYGQLVCHVLLSFLFFDSW
jgi:hypothetical protein